MAVVGVPKTIDNDILLMDKTFGFDTAVEEAQRAINSAYIEVQSGFDFFFFPRSLAEFSQLLLLYSIALTSFLVLKFAL